MSNVFDDPSILTAAPIDAASLPWARALPDPSVDLPATLTASEPIAAPRKLKPITPPALPVDEDLRPDAAPVYGENVATRSAAAAVSVDIQHDTSAPLPPLDDFLSSTTVNYRFNVSLPRGDARIPSMDLLMERLRSVISGDILTPPEKVELATASPAPRHVVTKVEADRASVRETGRPRFPRRGNIISPDGSNETLFYSMADLAAQLRAPYSGVNQKYLKCCREACVDPNDHEGLNFTYKGHKVFITVR
jgi:hypothetical protein